VLSCEWVEIRQFFQTESLLVVGFKWQRSSRKDVMLGYNKNYIALALNCMPNNSKRTILILKICKRDINKNIIKVKKHIKPLKWFLWMQKSIVKKDIKINVWITSTCKHVFLLTHS